jgi:hypothetical protein
MSQPCFTPPDRMTKAANDIQLTAFSIGKSMTYGLMNDRAFPMARAAFSVKTPAA